MKKLILLLLLAATLLAQRGNVNWTQIRIQDPIPLPGNNPMIIKLSQGHTANGLCVQSYTGATLFCVDASGNISTYASGGGQVVLYGATSGSVTLSVPAIAGSNNIILPASTGTVSLGGGSGANSVNVKDYGALCNNSADDTAEIQAALDASLNVSIPTGICLVSTTLRYRGGQHIIGSSGGHGAYAADSSVFRYTGSSTIPLLAPKTTTSDTIAPIIEYLTFDGGGHANPIISWYRTSYGKMHQIMVSGGPTGGVGITLDANVSNSCYFNTLDQVDVEEMSGTGIVFQNGANKNLMLGGKVANGDGAYGIQFLNVSSTNVIFGVDFENNVSGTHISVSSGANNYIAGSSFEDAAVGVSIGVSGVGTILEGNSYASTTTTPVSCVDTVKCSSSQIREFFTTTGASTDAIGNLRRALTYYGGSTTLDTDIFPDGGTSTLAYRFNYLVPTTSGSQMFEWYNADAGHTKTAFVNMGTGESTFTGLRLTTPVAVGSLGSCAAGTLGNRRMVNDANSAIPGATAAGGGTYTIAVQCIYNSSGTAYSWIID